MILRGRREPAVRCVCMWQCKTDMRETRNFAIAERLQNFLALGKVIQKRSHSLLSHSPKWLEEGSRRKEPRNGIGTKPAAPSGFLHTPTVGVSSSDVRTVQTRILTPHQDNQKAQHLPHLFPHQWIGSHPPILKKPITNTAFSIEVCWL